MNNANTNCLNESSTDQTSNTCGDYIKDPNNKTCILTSMSNCIECTSSNICTKCFNNKYLDSDLINCVDACLEQPPQTFDYNYPEIWSDETNHECKKCNAQAGNMSNCYTCVSANLCTKCNAPYYLDSI